MSRKTKWNEDNIKSEIEEVIDIIDRFPTQKDLVLMNKGYLVSTITKRFGGINHFREAMGYNIEHHQNNYWTDEIIIERLKEHICEVGYFPPYNKLPKKIASIMLTHGGVNKFRRILNYRILSETTGYWKEESIVEELKKIIKNIGHFPTREEIKKETGGYALCHAIKNNGGIIYYHKRFNINVSYKTLLAYYACKKGKKAENFVYDLLTDYCKRNSFPPPTKNVWLDKKRVIEFTCNVGKKIGVDVTTSRCERLIIEKWSDRKYHKFLDELLIVSFSDAGLDLNKLNLISPDNVTVIDIEKFCVLLQSSLNDKLKNKLLNIKTCTFSKRHLLLK